MNPEPANVAVINNSGDEGGLSTVRWSASGYDFKSLDTPLNVNSDGSIFELGTFTHLNFPIYTSISSIKLDLTIEDLNIFNINTVFTFDHNETSNWASPSSNPANNDIVKIENSIINELFEYGGDNYYFNLLGFSQDSGQTISTSFSTVEGQANTATLYGTITEYPITPGATATPEPATFFLFGLGILGIAGVSRKKTA